VRLSSANTLDGAGVAIGERREAIGTRERIYTSADPTDGERDELEGETTEEFHGVRGDNGGLSITRGSTWN
jgi:hypothetical protein